MEPKVWNRQSDDPPTKAIYVGRPTKWGNPWSHKASRLDDAITIVATREEAIHKFLLWITSDAPDAVRLRADAQRELKGKHLICWCAPADCHADIWLQIAND